jgi:hypothetical protein
MKHLRRNLIHAMRIIYFQTFNSNSSSQTQGSNITRQAVHISLSLTPLKPNAFSNRQNRSFHIFKVPQESESIQ